MKYNEAIDMILDGGNAYSDTSKEHGIYFHDGFLCAIRRNEEEIDPPNLSKEDFTGTKWIVEKDGVVYEEYPSPRYPMQPIYVDSQNVARFRKNEIVRYLLDNGGIDMNEIARLDFTQKDRTQFAQLIGYSISGYEGLSYISDKDANEASVKADKIWGDAQKDRAHEQDKPAELKEDKEQKENHIEKPRDKVTVGELFFCFENVFQMSRGLTHMANRLAAKGGYLDPTYIELEKELQDAQTALEKKLEYLVSLQEK